MSKNTIAIFSSFHKFNHLAAVYQARFDGAIKEYRLCSYIPSAIAFILSPRGLIKSHNDLSL